MTCMIDVDHDESYSTISDKIVKARKQYRCGECRADILPGEQHECYKGAFDGKIHTHRTCLTCVGIRKKIMCGWTFDFVYDDIHDAIDENPKLADCILMNVTRVEFEKLREHVIFFHDGEDDEE